MNRIIALTFGFVVLAFTGCVNGVKELEAPTSKHIYINAISSASSTEIGVETGFTKPIVGTSTDDEDDIELRALHNDTPVRVKKNGNTFTVVLDRRLSVGDKVTLAATSDKMTQVLAETHVLEAPMIISARGKWELSEKNKSRVRVDLSIQPMKEEAYYRLIARSGWYAEGIGLPQKDLLEREIISLGNPLFPQPKDQFFNEARNAPFSLLSLQDEAEVSFSYYDVKLDSSPTDPFRIDWEYSAEVELQRISRDYYLYLLTCMDSDNNTAFENPVKVHSNVIGGYGIFEVYSSSITPLIIEE